MYMQRLVDVVYEVITEAIWYYSWYHSISFRKPLVGSYHNGEPIPPRSEPGSSSIAAPRPLRSYHRASRSSHAVQ